ncbi:TRAP transporter small permease [Bradyrhizobium archetypum]|uniref:TRAP transporter small permease protein n=1 Tax=Bradyrhizobium archetypum TaxID=2721160 RepID=A0A7Y4H1L2_9BRAD|nr:TRAP transporter small permease [Bradyrhizobium archetypum]NOJ45963.1 TRAP transporter small permease [Bradyrhizobium archetypum]
MPGASLDKFSIRLKNVQLKLAMVALVVMMGITCLDVAMRFLFDKPIHGAYDVVEACLVVFVFHGLSVCFLARKNIVIDIIDSMVPPAVQRVLVRLSDILTVTLLALIVVTMIAPAMQAYDYGDRKLELGLKLWVLWMLAIAGLIGTLLCALGPLFRPVAPPRSHAEISGDGL